jgi:hypothetical protein
VSLLALWARAFGLTVVVELLVGVPLLAARAGGRGRRAAAVLLAQVATHPAVWFIFPELHLARGLFLLAAESWAVVAETLIYRFVFPTLTWRRALLVSVLANAASVGVGMLLRM